MKRFAMAVTLSLVLSASALAGEVPTVGVIPPPPAGTSTPTAPGEIPNSGYVQEMSEAALDFVEWVFSTVI